MKIKADMTIQAIGHYLNGSNGMKPVLWLTPPRAGVVVKLSGDAQHRLGHVLRSGLPRAYALSHLPGSDSVESFQTSPIDLPDISLVTDIKTPSLGEDAMQKGGAIVPLPSVPIELGEGHLDVPQHDNLYLRARFWLIYHPHISGDLDIEDLTLKMELASSWRDGSKSAEKKDKPESGHRFVFPDYLVRRDGLPPIIVSKRPGKIDVTCDHISAAKLNHDVAGGHHLFFGPIADHFAYTAQLTLNTLEAMVNLPAQSSRVIHLGPTAADLLGFNF